MVLEQVCPDVEVSRASVLDLIPRALSLKGLVEEASGVHHHREVVDVEEVGVQNLQIRNAPKTLVNCVE